jgi:RNA polymerase sigma-70 factor (ECF subfamily)
VSFNTAECLTRVRRRDPEAARSLVEHLYPLVIRLVRRHLPRRASEEDLAQDVFLRMFAKLDQYQGTVPLEHWVSRIAINHCLNAVRAQKSRPEWSLSELTEQQSQALEAATTATVQEPHPVHLISARELVDLLLATLKPMDRAVLRMLEMEERSIAEIRQITGWSATMIRVRAFRARRKLNQRFAELKKEGKV